MYSMSCVTPLPQPEKWLSSTPKLCVDTAHHAREFVNLLGELTYRFTWNVVHLDESTSIITAYYDDGIDTVISLSFHANGECSLQAKAGEISFSNTCYMDVESDNWLSVQTTVDVIFALIR